MKKKCLNFQGPISKKFTEMRFKCEMEIMGVNLTDVVKGQEQERIRMNPKRMASKLRNIKLPDLDPKVPEEMDLIMQGAANVPKFPVGTTRSAAIKYLKRQKRGNKDFKIGEGSTDGYHSKSSSSAQISASPRNHTAWRNAFPSQQLNCETLAKINDEAEADARIQNRKRFGVAAESDKRNACQNRSSQEPQEDLELEEGIQDLMDAEGLALQGIVEGEADPRVALNNLALADGHITSKYHQDTNFLLSCLQEMQRHNKSDVVAARRPTISPENFQKQSMSHKPKLLHKGLQKPPLQKIPKTPK